MNDIWRDSHRIEKSVISSVAVIFFLCSDIIISSLNIFLPPSSLRDTLFVIIMIFPIFINVSILIRIKPIMQFIDFFVPLFMVLIIFGVSILQHPEYSGIYRSIFWDRIFTVNVGVFGYLYARQINSPIEFLKVLKFSGIILFFYHFWRPIEVITNGYWLISINNVMVQSAYSMEFGYQMLTPTIFLGLFAIEEKKIFYVLLFIIGTIEILIFGSRTAFLSILLFLLFYALIFLYPKKHYSIRYVMIIFILFLGVLTAAFYNPLLSFATEILNRLNVNSRTINSLIEGTIISDSPRQFIWNRSLQLIGKRYFIGYGPLADQFLFGEYTHNIILEMMISFGIIAGMTFYLTFIYINFRVLLKTNNALWKKILLVFFSLCFLKLLVTSSFWYESSFWMSIGIAVTTLGLKADKPVLRKI